MFKGYTLLRHRVHIARLAGPDQTGMVKDAPLFPWRLSSGLQLVTRGATAGQGRSFEVVLPSDRVLYRSTRSRLFLRTLGYIGFGHQHHRCDEPLFDALKIGG